MKCKICRYQLILTDGYYDVSTSKPVGWYFMALVYHGPSGGFTVYHDGIEVEQVTHKSTFLAPFVQGKL